MLWEATSAATKRETPEITWRGLGSLFEVVDHELEERAEGVLDAVEILIDKVQADIFSREKD